MPDRVKIKPVQIKHLSRLLAWPNVTAVDINYKTVGGQKTDQLCLVIWVRTKRPESEISPDELLPKEIDGVPVDVFEGEAKLMEGFKRSETDQSKEPELKEEELGKLRSLDTLRGGDSLAPMNAKYEGTLGYFVKKGKTVGIISNYHVTDGPATKLISPAPSDGGTSNDYIGTVESTVLNQAVDCGYAPLRSNISKYYLKDGTSVTGSENAEVGTLIKFYGCTSGLVEYGAVQSIDWSTKYSGDIRNQILISAPIKPGDSGSLLLNRLNNKAIGLIFGNTTEGKGLANHIDEVLETLNVQIAVHGEQPDTGTISCQCFNTHLTSLFDMFS